MKLALVSLLFFAQQQPIEQCGGAKGHPCTCTVRIERIKAKALNECEKAGASTVTCQLQLPVDDCSLVDWGEQPESTRAKPDMADWCLRVCKAHDCKCGDKATCHIMHKLSDHPKGKGK